MTKMDMLEALKAKVAELNKEIEEIGANTELAKMTRSTQQSARRRDIRALTLISKLLTDNEEFDEDFLDAFEAITALRGTRSGGVVVHVRAGDNVLQLLQKYNTVKDPWSKIMKAATKAGLSYDNTTGMFN